MNFTAVILVWSIALAIGSFLAGQRVQSNADKAERLEAAEAEAENARHINRAILAAGVRTERAQAKTDATFLKIRTDYEAKQKADPSLGCVLDADSLRIWNAANAQDDDPAAASKPAGGMPAAAAAAAGGERGEQPRGSGPPIP